MSKFAKITFAIYLVTLVIVYLISKPVYWGILFTILVLQIINMVLRKYVDNKTKYKDSISDESEKMRFFYTYLGFPIALMFPDYFKKIRKDTYYVRKIQKLEDLIKMYTEHKLSVDQQIKDEWVNCNRYLKLKKLKAKHLEHETDNS
jgi:hypothetical protein